MRNQGVIGYLDLTISKFVHRYFYENCVEHGINHIESAREGKFVAQNIIDIMKERDKENVNVLLESFAKKTVRSVI